MTEFPPEFLNWLSIQLRIIRFARMFIQVPEPLFCKDRHSIGIQTGGKLRWDADATRSRGLCFIQPTISMFACYFASLLIPFNLWRYVIFSDEDVKVLIYVQCFLQLLNVYPMLVIFYHCIRFDLCSLFSSSVQGWTNPRCFLPVYKIWPMLGVLYNCSRFDLWSLFSTIVQSLNYNRCFLLLFVVQLMLGHRFLVLFKVRPMLVVFFHDALLKVRPMFGVTCHCIGFGLCSVFSNIV